MNHRSYPSTKAAMRAKLEALCLLPDDAEEWEPFLREAIRLPAWMRPAVQAAVRGKAWEAESDPLERIRTIVRRLAIEMRLSGAGQR